MKRIILVWTGMILCQLALAYQIEWGRTVTITKPVYEDLYVAGGTITLNAPVYGDVIIAGGTIYINDSVSNDLLVAGGTVFMNGYIGDDVRCAGGRTSIQKNIGGDVVSTGGTIIIEKDVIISGGFVTGGGEVILNGTVNGNIKAETGRFLFNGMANKNLDIRSQEIEMNGTVFGDMTIAARKIIIGNNASFYNNVRFWTRNGKLDVKGAMRNGNKLVYDPGLQVKTDNWYYLGHSTLVGLLWYISVVFLFILLIQYLFRRTFDLAADTVSGSLFKSLGWGLLFFVGVPFLALVLFVTIIGIPFGLMVLVSYIAFILLATVITSIVISNWYNHKFHQHWHYWQLVGSAMVAFILLKILTFTPLFGWLFMFITASIAFGALVQNIDWTGKRKLSLQ